jgi:hypothetical protein
VRIEEVVSNVTSLFPHVDGMIDHKAKALLESHRRVRTASRITGISYEIVPHRPADLLAVFQFLPAG